MMTFGFVSDIFERLIRITAIAIIATALILAACAVKCEAAPPMLGDTTGNGEISAYDASLAAQYAIELITLTPEEVQRADVTLNGEVSAYDASLIAQYAIELIDGF